MAEVNHDLMVKTLAEIERSPERWDQGWWVREKACGTAYCFAGHAAALSGYRIVQKHDRNAADAVAIEGKSIPEDITVVASRLLGLPAPEQIGSMGGEPFYACPQLFSDENDLDTLYRLCAQLMGVDELVLRDKVAAEV